MYAGFAYNSTANVYKLSPPYTTSASKIYILSYAWPSRYTHWPRLPSYACKNCMYKLWEDGFVDRSWLDDIPHCYFGIRRPWRAL